MDGLPNAGAAFDILLLLAATVVAHLGAATAVIYLLVDRRPARIVHVATLAVIAVVYVTVAVRDPGAFVGLVFGWGKVGHIKEDFPILATLPFVPFSLLLAVLAPLIRRVIHHRRTPKV